MTAVSSPPLLDVEAHWVHVEGAALPSGVVIDHGDHEMLVSWVPVEAGPTAMFTLDSLLPLTVVERIGCGTCPVQGRIEQGTWVPLKDGAS